MFQQREMREVWLIDGVKYQVQYQNKDFSWVPVKSVATDYETEIEGWKGLVSAMKTAINPTPFRLVSILPAVVISEKIKVLG